MLEYLPPFVPQPVDSIHYAILIGWLTTLLALLVALAALLIDYFVSFVKWISQRGERRKEAHMRMMRQVLSEMGAYKPPQEPPAVYLLRKQA